MAIYNRLVKLRNTVRASWSDIEVQLKKRYDLVPNLVETVKGYASHEKTLFEKVTEARSMAMRASSLAESLFQFFLHAASQISLIDRFHSEISINKDYSITVKEPIEVGFFRPKDGIYREIPLLSPTGWIMPFCFSMIMMSFTGRNRASSLPRARSS